MPLGGGTLHADTVGFHAQLTVFGTFGQFCVIALLKAFQLGRQSTPHTFFHLPPSLNVDLPARFRFDVWSVQNRELLRVVDEQRRDPLDGFPFKGKTIVQNVPTRCRHLLVLRRSETGKQLGLTLLWVNLM
ncbi:hypothetical protein B4915_00805 [Leucobacter massiliensis]|uniref:Uncharacterized protein n=1 Tax=Leucobacter massiliensis TaxID=1686285 RepID=A0A2S9QSF5_9MICO|nr:hypothetical protein B4915_00805 [Leucobacter massiliensis]